MLKRKARNGFGGMERLGTEEDTPVAPQEVRELLARLNEASLDVSSHGEKTRTLGSLAVETGIPVSRLRQELQSVRGDRHANPIRRWGRAVLITLVLGAGGWLWTTLESKEGLGGLSIANPFGALASGQGLVAMDTVRFGPDQGQYQVEPSFQAPKTIKPGLSIAAEVQGVMWGMGDHRAQNLREPLTEAEEADLIRSLESLLRHVRNRAEKRGMAPAVWVYGGNPELAYEGKAYTVTLFLQAYQSSNAIQVPVPPLGADEEDFERLSRAAVKTLVSKLQGNLKFFSRF